MGAVVNAHQVECAMSKSAMLSTTMDPAYYHYWKAFQGCLDGVEVALQACVSPGGCPEPELAKYGKVAKEVRQFGSDVSNRALDMLLDTCAAIHKSIHAFLPGFEEVCAAKDIELLKTKVVQTVDNIACLALLNKSIFS